MDQRIRVHADGEFSALKRQLKGLETDFKRFEGVVNRGASKGGLFSKADLSALETFRQRYTEMDRHVQRSISEQIQKVRQLEKERQKAYGNEKKRIEDEIRARKQLMNEMRNQQGYLRERYDRTDMEAQGFGSEPSKSKMAKMPGSGMLGRGLGMALGALGIGSVMGTLMKAYNEAVAREKYASDLAMRVSGTRTPTQADVSRLRYSTRDIGLRYGYDGLESMMAVDNVSKRMGVITGRDQAAVMGLTRAYGLELAATSDTMGRFGQLGAVNRNGMREFADMIAGAIDKSGMSARAEEQMKATQTLVESLADAQPGSINARSIAALQTVLNQTGSQGFMGERGANFITQLSSMFSSGNSGVSMFIDRALGYGKNKSYYDVQLQKEKGISDPTNLSAVLNAVSRIGGGLSAKRRAEMQDFALSNMTGISLTEAKTLREQTNGYTDLSKSKIDAMSATISQSGTIDASVTAKDTHLGQQTSVSEANFTEALANLGTPLIQPMNELRDTASDAINSLAKGIDSIDNLSNWIKALIAAMAVSGALSVLGGKGISIPGLGGGKGGGKGGGAGGGKGGASGGKGGGRAGKIAGAVTRGGAVAGLLAAAGVIAYGVVDSTLHPENVPHASISDSVANKAIADAAKGQISTTMGTDYTDSKAIQDLIQKQQEESKGFTDAIKNGTTYGAPSAGITADQADAVAGFLSGKTPLNSTTASAGYKDMLNTLAETQEKVFGDSSLKELISQNKHQDTLQKNQKDYFTDSKTSESKFQDDITTLVKSGVSDISAYTSAMASMAGSAITASGVGPAVAASLGSGVVGGQSIMGYNPFSKYQVSSGFGNRLHPILGYSRMHNGTDFAMAAGTPLQAMMSGTVDSTGYNSEMGNFIKVKTGSGDIYTYEHMMTQALLKAGQKVNAGDILGNAGATGLATGPHLHLGYQKLINGQYQYVDPMSILKTLPTSPQALGYASTSSITQSGGYVSGTINVNVKGLPTGINQAAVEKIVKDVINTDTIRKLLANPASTKN